MLLRLPIAFLAASALRTSATREANKCLWYTVLTMKKCTGARPLELSEVPADLQALFDFENQRLEQWNGKGKNRMTIERRCKGCGIAQRTLVAGVRESLRLNRLSGHCRRCSEKQSRPCLSKGEKHYAWKGGIRTDSKGYVHVREPEHPNSKNGYVQQHRLVMENHLGRLLLPSETVHHKNGVKSDNRLENLELWSRSHGDGCRYSDLSNQQVEEIIVFLQRLLAERKA